MYWKCDGVGWGTATQGDCLLSGETDLLSLELEVLLLLSDLRSGDLGEYSLFFSTGFATGSLKLFLLFHGWFPLGIFHHIGQSCHGLFRDRSLGSSWGAFDLILLMLEAGGRAEGWIWILDDSDLGSEGGVGARNGWDFAGVSCLHFSAGLSISTFWSRAEVSSLLAFVKTGSSTVLFSTYSMFDRSTPCILAVS